mmetsp:Transcript_7001/g.20300  ORF Transcript_7001/g.20300 Transcript_7001/m.20300 type:complete len:203 (-) Transcript_7001:2733-3341(-)
MVLFGSDSQVVVARRDRGDKAAVLLECQLAPLGLFFVVCVDILRCGIGAGSLGGATGSVDVVIGDSVKVDKGDHRFVTVFVGSLGKHGVADEVQVVSALIGLALHDEQRLFQGAQLLQFPGDVNHQDRPAVDLVVVGMVKVVCAEVLDVAAGNRHVLVVQRDAAGGLVVQGNLEISNMLVLQQDVLGVGVLDAVGSPPGCDE